MIIDKLENYGLYSSLGPRIARGLKFLTDTDFSKAEAGKHIIEDDKVYAVISNYTSKDMKDCKLEAHRKYIDIQYIASGRECIGVIPFRNQVPVIPYNEEKDVLFFSEDVTLIPLETGMFAIFFPDDLHMPGIRCNDPVDVRKVVVKVRV